jgi:ABC-type sugar transport system ATPase subunit
MRDWRIKAESVDVTPDALSGGNQQKVVLAKWLALQPRVLLLDEPTKGVDVGAKYEIHEVVRELASKGAACLVVSSDLPEVLALADRILVMREGRIRGEMAAAGADEEKVMRLAAAVPGEAA